MFESESSHPNAAERGGRSGRNYLLIALTLFYTSSFVDRSIIYIIAESLKRDLALTDTELGLLGGLAFAAVYAGLGIPVARIAERRNRLTIITIALTIWSVMTMLCAAAMNFWQLALARAGVGIGEAACTPCAHSMIGDSFPPQRRATALSIYSLGIPVGTLAGTLGGAWVAEAYSWRAAFIVVGAPGLLLALLAAFTLKEPQRGRYDPPVAEQPPSLMVVVRHLWSRPAFRHLLAGVTLSTMAAAGHQVFTAPFLLRGDFDIGLSGVAVIVALFYGGAGFLGTLIGGLLGDRLSRRDQGWLLRVPAIAYFGAAPLFALAFASNSLTVFVGLGLIGYLLATIYLGPTFGALHNMVEPRMRATAVAIVLAFASLMGLGVGPVLVGGFSDYAAQALYHVSPDGCGASPTPDCTTGIFSGLRIALIINSIFYIWPGIHYFLAASKLKESLLVVAPEHPRPAH